MSKKFAVFDIDGTVIRWQLYHAIGDALAKQGVIHQNDFDPVREARMNWKRRTGQESFLAYESALVQVFDKALVGQPEEAMQKAADSVFNEYKDQVYTYTRDLLLTLKNDGYLLFAISGSPKIIVERLASYYGFDDFAATNYPTENGHYTGLKDLSIGRKAELLQALITKHQVKNKHSIGVGDTEGDIEMLEMVDQQIAFNPSKKLFEYAAQRGWTVVIERKNMVYQMELVDGSYVLAQTNA